MKCLVTGATGFIGQELCRQLSAAEHEFLPYSCTGQSLADGTGTHAIDFRKANLSGKALAGIDVVFHLAGIAHQQASAEDYERVNYLAAVELARLSRDAGVRCFILLSSVKAMGPALSEGARTESDSVLPDSQYGLSKWQAEADINREFDRGDMSVCILRPALVYGSGAKGNLEMLARAIGRGLPRPPEIGSRSMIGVSDLSRLMLALAREGKPGVSTFIASDGQAYSLRRTYEAIRSARGKSPGVAWCPRWLWHSICGVQDWRRPGDESTWQKLFGSELYCNDSLLQSTSWRPTQRLEDCLRAEASAEAEKR